MQVTQPHVGYTVSMQSKHHTIRFRFWPDTPADIRPHPFQKFESGTSLILMNFDKSQSSEFLGRRAPLRP